MAKKQTTSSRTPTRRQVAISRKEREQRRLVYLGLGGMLVLMLVVLGIGLFQTYVIEPNAPVVSVEETEITTADYQSRVRYERYLLDEQLLQIQQQLQTLPQGEEDDQFTQLLRNQYEQFGNQILQRRAGLDRQVVDTLVEDQLVMEEAQQQGITVTGDEVTEFINRIAAGRAGGLTEAAVSETSTAAAEFTATAAVWTPTPTLTPSPTLTTTESISPTATPADTPTPAPTPTPNIISGTNLSTEYQNWVNTLSENAGIDEATYREYIRLALLRDKLREALGEDVPRIEEQTRARHILVETEEEAQAVIDRLETGEDFGEVAQDVSTDPGSAAQGGDLGFVPQGQFVEAFEEAVFSLPIGQVSEPVESDFGWHVIEVLEREERELSDADYARRQSEAYTNWLQEARGQATVEDFWTIDKVPEDSFFQQQ